MNHSDQAMVAVMPRPSNAWSSAAGLWVTAAGWAAAGSRRFGHAWVVTPDATAKPETALSYATAHYAQVAGASRASWVPRTLRTAAKDAVQYRRIDRFQVGPGPWQSRELALVWQHHEVYHHAGIDLARRHHCPVVLFVHAPQIWEARQWGVRRPGWGQFLERKGEVPQLCAADAVACVSDEVAREVIRMGALPSRVVVTPMAVDPERFSPDISGDAVRSHYGLDDDPVVGWLGNFRRFHGLEMALEAFAEIRRQVPTARMLLVGDGPERSSIEADADRLGLREAIVFTGGVPHLDMPEHLAAMDVALVLARGGESFHYSPHKMREYLACGVPVVAPAVGDVARMMHDGEDALLYEPGDTRAVARATLRLLDDPDLRARIGKGGRDLVLREGTWDAQLDKVARVLGL
jgi:glycosyltransferase involved in cell wall biosynthesis